MTNFPSLLVVRGPTCFLMSTASNQSFTLGIGVPWLSVTTPLTRVMESAVAGLVGARATTRAKTEATARNLRRCVRFMASSPPNRPAQPAPVTGPTILYSVSRAIKAGACRAWGAPAGAGSAVAVRPAPDGPGREDVPGEKQRIERSADGVRARENPPHPGVGQDLHQVAGGDHRHRQRDNDDAG